MIRLANPLSRDRRKQAVVLLVLLHAALVFGYILPVLEEAKYYSSKIAAAESEYRILTKESLYIDHHKRKYVSIKTELEDLKKNWMGQTDYRHLQKRLGAFQRKNHLTVISQKITRAPTDDIFAQQIVKQVLSGKYADLMRYFGAIYEDGAPVVFSYLSLTSQNPASADPTVRSELELRYFDMPK